MALIRFGAAILAAVLAAGPAAATAIPADSTLSPDWRFALRPYFFLSGLTGSVTADNVTMPINTSFADLLGNVRMGGFVNGSAEKGQWGLNADFEYIELRGEGWGVTDTVLELRNVIGEADILFRPAAAPTLRFLVGVRVYAITQNLRLVGVDLPQVSTTVVDPVLGAAGAWKLHDRWNFELRGDIGGFGVSSESTYQLAAAFRWTVGGTTSIPFGYRVLGYQIGQDEVRMDIRMSGLMLGADFRF